MTKYLNFFESESGFTEAVEAGQLFFPNVSYTEEDDTVHWNLTQPANPVETPMLRMSFSTSSPGEGVKLGNCFTELVTAMEIDGTPVNYVSGGTISIAEPGNHTAVYQFYYHEIPSGTFRSDSGEFDTFTSAEITSAVTSISGSAFSHCSGLSSVTIPDSVTTIGFGAFSHTGLRSITVPDSVTTLGQYVFNGCTELRTATVGSGITTIPFQTFSGCTSLQSVTMPDSLTDIDHGVFMNCSSLDDINIPSGVTRIGLQAFIGCSGLTAIYLNPETPPSLGANALDNTNNCPIYVPSSSVETYKQAWSAYASRIMSKHRISASVNDDSLGEVSLDKETASEGDLVDFHVDVFEIDKYQVSSVSITDGNGNEVEYEGYEYDYTFHMPASDVTISVTIGEKEKHTVTVNSTDGLVNPDDIHFNSDDGEPSFGEGNMAGFFFNLPDDLQLVSVQASDCDGNSIEVELEDEGHGSHSCHFIMPSCDVTISVEIGEKEKPKHTVTVNSTDDLVTGAYPINEETGDWDWDYEGELSFLEGEPADFAIRLPEGYLAVSAQASDCDGFSIGGVNLNRQGDDGAYECSFTMPRCDASVFITVEADTRPRYNITASVNDDSLGRVDLDQDIALEGESVYFDVKVFDTDANHVSSVTCTDGNGNEIKCWWDFDERDYSRYHISDLPASDVTIFATIEPKQ